MTSINGAKHDVEDILASIRTSIADRAPIGIVNGRIHTLRGSANIADELPDFELPAIFKPAAAAAAEKPNLLGRLSEALSTSGEQSADRSRTVIRFEPAYGRMSEQQIAAAAASAKQAEPAPVEKRAESNDVKRVMPSFFDTRINRMGELTRVATEPPAAPPARQATLSPQSQQPPQLPDAAGLLGSGAMEDAAAQLLRPILKQWLTENMPKIVEKALRSEMGEDRNGTPRR